MSDVTGPAVDTVQRMMKLREYVLALLVGSLSATILLKFGDIQYLELILAMDFLVLLGIFFYKNLWFRAFRPFLSIGLTYGIFLALALLLGVLALRNNFYLVGQSVFKKPLLLTIARMAELFLDVFYMLYLASLYREDERICKVAAKTYYWTGVAGAIYALLSLPLNLIFHLNWGAYTESHRLRGFNNEAGSYGTYLISVCLVTLAMRRRGWISRRQFNFSMGLFAFCLLGSQSKAALLALMLLGLLNIVLLLHGWNRLGVLAAMGVAAMLLANIFNLQRGVSVYFQGAAQYQVLSRYHSDDPNLVMGRVAGAVLGPRMLIAHPFLGIGWGNYPLVRDDPEYRRGSAFSLGDLDSPSLGPLDYMVELGLPLWLYLTWAELKPMYLLFRHGADIWIMNMAGIQILANWFGAHLNLTYPWVVVGLSLGMGFSRSRISQAEGSRA